MYVCMYVCMYVSHVLDRKLLERLMSPKSQESVIFSNFWDSYFSSYGEFGEFSLRFTAAMSGRSAVAVCQTKQLITLYCRGLWTSLALLKWAAAIDGPR